MARAEDRSLGLIRPEGPPGHSTTGDGGVTVMGGGGSFQISKQAVEGNG